MARTRSKFDAPLAAIFLLAVAFRVYDIDRLDVWIDEANAILTASQSLPVVFQKLRLDSSPPLYYVVLHGWIRLFGDGALAVRLLSSLFSLALVAATYAAGKELISRPVGLWAAAFIAVSPVQAYYSQQARMYTLLPLLALLSVFFLVRYLRDERPRDAFLWVGSTVLAVYDHNFALFVLPVHGVLVALSGKLLTRFRTWALAAAVIALAYGPWLPFFLEQVQNKDHYAWFESYWQRWGVLGSIFRSVRSWSPGAEYVSFGGLSQYARWGGLPTLASLLLAGYGAYRLARRRHGAVEDLWPTVYLLVPIAAALLVSWLVTPNYVAGRVDQMMLPAFALLVGTGLQDLGPRPLRVAAAISLLAVAGYTRWTLFPPTPKVGLYKVAEVRHEVSVSGTDRALVAAIAERWRPGDVIVTTSLTRASIQYYLGRQGIDARFVSYPRETASHLGSQNDTRLLADPRALVKEADAAMAEARRLASADGRIFLVRVRARVNGPLRESSVVGRMGLERIERLGDFAQTGSSSLVEAALYRPRRRSQRPVDSGST